ncbi:MAG: sigma-70 family RNA polymerase sigma factor [Ruminiclostridium sp.]|nr:sigma-70 family RNA polymerase sigma factor [Ruminiclostridium sp.]
MNVQDELERIYRKHYLTVYRLAVAKSGGRIENAKDVFGEVFFQLLRYLDKGGSFNDENHEKAWLIRVTINCSKVILRTYNSGNSEELILERFSTMPENGYGEVYEAVMKLPQKYRVVIHLFYYEDYSIKEIAEILKIKENTVKSQLSRGRKLLKGDLEKGGLDYGFEKI